MLTNRKRRKVLLFLAVSFIIIFFCYQKQFLSLEKDWLESKSSDLKQEESKPKENQEDEKKQVEKNHQEEIKKQGITHKATIWVSMSLCWFENAQIRGKAAFPYTLAAQLSSRLWRKITEGEANVLITIIFNEETKALNNYVKSFEEVVGVVIALQKTTELGCVLQSQLSRMFAFRHEAISDTDIILTSDVELFVMTKGYSLPLNKSYTTWIYQYIRAAETGETFPMCVIGMRARDWRQALDYSHVGVENYDVNAIFRYFKNKTGNWNSDEETFWFDQWLVTYSILSRGYCSLPDEHPLWTGFGLTPPTRPQNNEAEAYSSTMSSSSPDLHPCYKGVTYVCGRGQEAIPPGGCLFWHFHPDAGEEEMRNDFERIMNNSTNLYN